MPAFTHDGITTYYERKGKGQPIRHPGRIDRLVLAATSPYASPRNTDLFATWSTLFKLVDRPLWFRNLFCGVLSPAFFDNARTVDAPVQIAATYPRRGIRKVDSACDVRADRGRRAFVSNREPGGLHRARAAVPGVSEANSQRGRTSNL